MATAPKATRPARAGLAAENKREAAKAAEESRRAAAFEVPERQPGGDLDPEDLAQFDG